MSIGEGVIVPYQVRLFEDDCLIGSTEIYVLLAKMAYFPWIPVGRPSLPDDDSSGENVCFVLFSKFLPIPRDLFTL